MSLTCPKCGEDNPKNNRFCDHCGSKLDSAEKAAPAPAPARPARKAVEPAAVAASAGPAPAAAGALFGLNRDLVWLLVIIAFGAFLRLWALGDKPLHHDESIHAWYSFKLFTDGGGAYKYDPAYHGPFLYHANALMYFIFGTSDFASRVLPAIFGIAILGFLWAWKPLLGRMGVLITALLVAVSPTITYVSRFIRDDIYMTLGCMMLVWGMFRWFEERKPSYLYWGMAGYVVSFTSMEATWIFSGIIGSFLITRWLWEHLEKSQGEEAPIKTLLGSLLPKPQGIDGLGLLASTAGMLGSVGLYIIAARASGNPGILGFLKVMMGLGILGFIIFAVRYIYSTRNTVLAWLLAIFFVPFTVLFTTMFFNADGWFTGAFNSLAYWLGEQKTGRADQPWFFYFGLLALYEMGIVVFALLGGFRIVWGSGKAEHFLLRLSGLAPIAVSFLMLTRDPKDPVALIFMAGMATLGCSVISFFSFERGKHNLFKVFLLHWMILATVMFSLAGERMPWLTLHPLTPMVLLAGLYLGELFERKEPLLSEQWLAWSVLWVPFTLLAVMVPVVLYYVSLQAPAEVSAWLNSLIARERHASAAPSGLPVNLWSYPLLSWLCLLLPIVPIAATPLILKRWPVLRTWTRGVWVGLVVVAVAGLLHGTHNLLFYGDGANPAEQLVYVQSSTEIPKLKRRLEDMSHNLTGGMLMKIAVEDTCSWPLSWYLRDLPGAVVGYRPPFTLDQIKPPQAPLKPGEEPPLWPMEDYPPICITAYDNNPPQVGDHDVRVERSLLPYYNPNRMKLRVWWGPNGEAVNAERAGGWDKVFGKFMALYLFREPWPALNQGKDNFGNITPIGSYDMCVWVRKDVEKQYWQ